MSKTKEIADIIGKDVLISGDAILEEEKQIIPWSPCVDIILVGGVPEGSWVTLTGEPKCGKTTSALHFAAKCQSKEHGERNVYYLNIEGRLKQRDLEGIPNLKMDKFFSVQSYYDKKTGEGRILTAEEYLSYAEKILKDDPGCLVIIDSVSQLITQKELEGEMGEAHRAPGAKVVSQFCRRVANLLPVNGNIVIAITHLIANISGYGKTKVESGGRKIAYAVDIKMHASKVEKWFASSSKKVDDLREAPVGQIITWITESTAIVPPGRKITSYLRYGKGIDEITELVTLGQKLGFITGKGWYTCNFMQEHLDVLDAKEWDEETQKRCKAQGQEKLSNLLRENPEWLSILEKEIKGMLT